MFQSLCKTKFSQPILPTSSITLNGVLNSPPPYQSILNAYPDQFLRSNGPFYKKIIWRSVPGSWQLSPGSWRLSFGWRQLYAQGRFWRCLKASKRLQKELINCFTSVVLQPQLSWMNWWWICCQRDLLPWVTFSINLNK